MAGSIVAVAARRHQWRDRTALDPPEQVLSRPPEADAFWLGALFAAVLGVPADLVPGVKVEAVEIDEDDAVEETTVETVDVRFRTVGDMTCTCPVESLASSTADIVAETLQVTVSERGATRMDDRTSEASMERRKKEGYF